MHGEKSLRFKIMLSNIFSYLKKFDFFSDSFILAMIVLGALLNSFLWYYIKSKIYFTDGNFEFGFFMDMDSIYKAPLLIIIFSLVNILVAKIIYNYDIFASYILIATVPFLSFVYFFGIFTVLSLS